MRHLEIHVIETDRDIDLAVQAGLLDPAQLTASTCADCDEPLGHSDQNGFKPFAVVLDEHDSDWPVCIDCASPVVDSGLGKQISYEALLDEEYLEGSPSPLFDEDEFEQF